MIWSSNHEVIRIVVASGIYGGTCIASPDDMESAPSSPSVRMHNPGDSLCEGCGYPQEGGCPWRVGGVDGGSLRVVTKKMQERFSSLQDEEKKKAAFQNDPARFTFLAAASYKHRCAARKMSGICPMNHQLPSRICFLMVTALV